MDKRAYAAYFIYLLDQEKHGANKVNGHSINEEQEEVKKHIDNIDIKILQYENERIDN